MTAQLLRPPVTIGMPRAASATARNAMYPSPTDGDMAYRTDIDGLNIFTSSFGWQWAGATKIYSYRVPDGTNAASVTFSNIPQEFKHLLVITEGRTNAATNYDDVGLRFNGDAGSNYTWHTLYGYDGSGAVNAILKNEPAAWASTIFSASNQPSGEHGGGYLWIPNYSSVEQKKYGVGHAATMSSNYTIAGTRNFAWNNTAAITSLTWLCRSGSTIRAWSKFDVYGVS